MSEPNPSDGLNHDLLDLFIEAGGEAVGVVDIIQTLNIPRERLYADLDRLRDAGYVIGKTHPYGSTGYQLLEVPDRLFAFEVERRVRTRWLGRRIECRPSCESTNDVAKDLAKEGAPHGTVVLAETQTGGRGRGGNRWHSPPDIGLYLSILLRPGADANAPAVLQITTAVGVAWAAMKRTGKAARIRWPNDVVMGGRKVAGILAEAENAGTEDAVFVVGIGMNVAHRREDFPADLRESATSLAIEAATPQKRLAVLPTLLATLEDWYDRMTAGDLTAIETAWRPLSVLLGRDVSLVRRGERVEGRVAEFSLTEGLKLATPAGEEWIPAEHATQVRLLGEGDGDAS